MNMKSEMSKRVPEWVLKNEEDKIALVDVNKSPGFAKSKEAAEVVVLYNSEMKRVNIITDEEKCLKILSAFEKDGVFWVGGIGMIWPSDFQEITPQTARAIYHFVAGALGIDSVNNS